MPIILYLDDSKESRDVLRLCVQVGDLLIWISNGRVDEGYRKPLATYAPGVYQGLDEIKILLLGFAEDRKKEALREAELKQPKRKKLPRGALTDPTLNHYHSPSEAVAALFDGEPTSDQPVPLQLLRIVG